LRNEEHQHDAKQETSKFKDNESWAQWYDKWKTQTVHPNLRIDFFETIDTKEKAYWLGFLYADGYLIEHPNRAEIRLKLKIKDEETINRFCDTLQLDKDKKEYVIDEGGHTEAMIRFCCRKMSDGLISHGLTFRKSKTIQLPKLPHPSLELAFLLGYYDGDGRTHTTIISSGSNQFLEQVKERYKLLYKIQVDKRQKEIYGRSLNGINYMMCLGPELFNKMMKNYANSMQRKRWSPCEREERIRRAKEACAIMEVRKRSQSQFEWRAMTEERLEELVQKMPLKKIAEKYNVSQSPNITRKCKKFGIAIPDRGYWTKIYWSSVKSLERNNEEKQSAEN
jgi:hypothetical protein